jgi:carbon-monoxide dehydrogenase small subunit
MVLAVVDLLNRHPDPTDEQIKEGLSGNLCRCTGYASIIRAVHKAATMLKERI